MKRNNTSLLNSITISDDICFLAHVTNSSKALFQKYPKGEVAISKADYKLTDYKKVQKICHDTKKIFNKNNSAEPFKTKTTRVLDTLTVLKTLVSLLST